VLSILRGRRTCWLIRWISVEIVGIIICQMLSGFEPINIVFFPQTQALLSFVLAVGAIILFRRVRRWPALLILIGALGFFIMHLSNAISAYTITGDSSFSPSVLRWWGVLDNLAGVATVLLPLGLLAFALLPPKASNQAMQRPAPRSDA
jgi:hypothetical protein